MASDAVHSKVVIPSFINCLLLLSLGAGFNVGSLFCREHLVEESRAGCFTLLWQSAFCVSSSPSWCLGLICDCDKIDLQRKKKNIFLEIITCDPSN